MAAQSIVDFVKESLSKGSAANDSQQGEAAYGSSDVAAAVIRLLGKASTMSGSAVSSPANERLYVTYASKVLSVLQGSPGMTVRQAFDATGDDDFPSFQLAVAEMLRRGLLHVSGRDTRYGDEIYTLSSQPTA